jgi:hypothetical protein
MALPSMAPELNPTKWDPRVWAGLAVIAGVGFELAHFTGVLERVEEFKRDFGVALLVFAFLTFTFEGRTRAHIEKAAVEAATNAVDQAREHIQTAATEAAREAVSEVRTMSIEKFLTATVGAKLPRS